MLPSAPAILPVLSAPPSLCLLQLQPSHKGSTGIKCPGTCGLYNFSSCHTVRVSPATNTRRPPSSYHCSPGCPARESPALSISWQHRLCPLQLQPNYQGIPCEEHHRTTWFLLASAIAIHPVLTWCGMAQDPQPMPSIAPDSCPDPQGNVVYTGNCPIQGYSFKARRSSCST